MNLTRSLWSRVLELQAECRRRDVGISRGIIKEALQLCEHDARFIRDALKYQSIIALQHDTFNVESQTKELVLSDIHIPYEDKVALEAALSFGDAIQPDIITLLGDTIDFYQASTFVKSPVKKPISAELKLTRLFLSDLRARFPKAKILFLQGNHECYSDDTEVLTKSGWKLFKDLVEGDEVGTYDTETKEIFYEAPRAYIEKPFKGDMVHVSTQQGVDILVTPQHAMLVTIPNNPTPVHCLAQDFVGADGVRRGFITAAQQSITEPCMLSDMQIRLLGWFITDASIGKKSGTLTFYQSEGETNDELVEVLTSNSLTFRTSVRDRGITHICGKALKKRPKVAYEYHLTGESTKAVCSLFGEERKRLPDICWKFSKRQLDIFLDTVIKADGSVHKSSHNSMVLYKSLPILEDMQRLLIVNNYRATLSEYRPAHWRLNITPKPLSIVDRIGTNTKLVPYDGKVYCAEVSTHNLVVRRKGKPVICGNCRLDRYLMSQASEIYDLVNDLIETKLGFKELGIEYITEPFKIGKLNHLHGHEKGKGMNNPEYITNVVFNFVLDHFICGHFHRSQEKIFKRIDKSIFLGTSVGYLAGDMEYAQLNKWNQGFATVIYGDRGRFKAQNHKIFNGEVY